MRIQCEMIIMPIKTHKKWMKHSLIEIVHKSKRMLYKCTELWCFLLAWFFLHKSTFCWSVFEANELLSKLPANIIPNPIHEMHFKSAKRLKLRIESSAEVIFYFLMAVFKLYTCAGALNFKQTKFPMKTPSKSRIKIQRTGSTSFYWTEWGFNCVKR